MVMMVTSESELILAMRSRRVRLGLSLEKTDHIAGFHDGYTGKLEHPAAKWGKRAANYSLWTWLGALKVAIVLVPVVRVKSQREAPTQMWLPGFEPSEESQAPQAAAA